MPVVAAIGSVLLLGVFLVHPGKRGNLWVFAGVLILTPVVLTYGIGTVVGRSTAVYPEARSEGIIGFLEPVLQDLANDPPENVILLEGASWTSRDIDGPRLESELAESGIDAAVIQVSVPGGNHFERDHMLRTLADSLDATQMDNLAEANVLALREVSRVYDEHPIINGVDRNPFTNRVYAYSTPTRSYAMAKAALAAGDLTPLRLVQIGQHAIFTWLRISEGSRLDGPRVTEHASGHQSLDTTTDGTTLDLIPDIVDAMGESPEQSYAYVFEGMGSDSFGLPIDLAVDLELPTLRLESGRYARWIAAQEGRTVILVDDPDLYRRLDDPDKWYDMTHLRREGAEIYTSWLAERIANVIRAES